MYKICVLMSTFNGLKYLNQQIESVLNQKDVFVSLLVRDDGSTDGTQILLEKYQKKGVLSWYQGSNLKPARSFLELLRKSSDADFYAFCDQDDLWLDNKLISAIKKLIELPRGIPSLYFSNTTVTDDELRIIRTTNYTPTITLESALLKFSPYGCTEVFNKRLRDEVNKYTNTRVTSHDNWIYKVCLAFQGNVVFDKNSYIYYRQHSDNFIGVNSNKITLLLSKIKRTFFVKDHVRRIDAQELLRGYEDILGISEVNIIKKVAYYNRSFRKKLDAAFDRQLHPFSFFENISIICSFLLGNI